MNVQLLIQEVTAEFRVIARCISLQPYHSDDHESYQTCYFLSVELGFTSYHLEWKESYGSKRNTRF